MDVSKDAMDRIRSAAEIAMRRLEELEKSVGLTPDQRREMGRTLGHLDYILIVSRAHGSGGPPTAGEMIRDEKRASAAVTAEQALDFYRASGRL